MSWFRMPSRSPALVVANLASAQETLLLCPAIGWICRTPRRTQACRPWDGPRRLARCATGVVSRCRSGE